MATIVRGTIIGEPSTSGGGGGAVDSVNGQTGVVVLDLDDLGDVDTTGVLNNYVLTYDSGISTWVAAAPGGVASVSASSVIVNDSAFTVLSGTNAQVVFDDIDDLFLGTGDVDGPTSATDNAIALFDGTTGKLLQNSTATLDPVTGAMFIEGTAPNVIVSTSVGYVLVGADLFDPNILGIFDGGGAIAVKDGNTGLFSYNAGAIEGDGTFTNFSGTSNFLGNVSVSGQLTVTSVRATGSGGVLIESNSGTNVALFGAGGGAGTTLYGQLNGEAAVFGGAVTVSSSITAQNLSGTNTGDQVLNATGFVSAGAGLAISGAGTSASPYVLSTSAEVRAAGGMILGEVSAKDYRIGLNIPFGFTINSVTTRSGAGTATMTTKINTTAIGATANSVSTSEQEQTATSANVFVSGDDLVLTFTSVATCSDVSFTIKYTRG